MPSYRRAHQPGGTFFFTVVTDRRAPLFTQPAARQLLRTAITTARESRPFTIDSFVLLPEHFHLMMTLPTGDADYSTRIAHLKSLFTKSWLDAGHAEQPRSAYRLRTRRRGVWQPRFWEHVIRDRNDYNNHLDYIHYNPIKHNHVPCPHLWPHTTFHRAVKQNLYANDWLCTCNGQHPIPPTFGTLPVDQMELESP
jgi:putative transposase